MFTFTFLVLYSKRLSGAKATDEDYVCIEIYEDGSVLTNNWPEKWLKAFRLNIALFVFLSIF